MSLAHFKVHEAHGKDGCVQHQGATSCNESTAYQEDTEVESLHGSLAALRSICQILNL